MIEHYIYGLYRSSNIFWSDVANGLIYQADMNGNNAEVLASEDILLVGKCNHI